jgi:hypothetical protein
MLHHFLAGFVLFQRLSFIFQQQYLALQLLLLGGVMVCPALTVAPDGTVARQLSCHSTVIATVPSERAA